MKTVSVYLEENLWKRFKMKCLEKGTTLTDQMAALIQEWLDGKQP